MKNILNNENIKKEININIKYGFGNYDFNKSLDKIEYTPKEFYNSFINDEYFPYYCNTSKEKMIDILTDNINAKIDMYTIENIQDYNKKFLDSLKIINEYRGVDNFISVYDLLDDLDDIDYIELENNINIFNLAHYSFENKIDRLVFRFYYKDRDKNSDEYKAFSLQGRLLNDIYKKDDLDSISYKLSVIIDIYKKLYDDPSLLPEDSNTSDIKNQLNYILQISMEKYYKNFIITPEILFDSKANIALIKKLKKYIINVSL